MDWCTYHEHNTDKETWRYGSDERLDERDDLDLDFDSQRLGPTRNVLMFSNKGRMDRVMDFFRQRRHGWLINSFLPWRGWMLWYTLTRYWHWWKSWQNKRENSPEIEQIDLESEACHLKADFVAAVSEEKDDWKMGCSNDSLRESMYVIFSFVLSWSFFSIWGLIDSHH